jgi:hypothetical protein
MPRRFREAIFCRKQFERRSRDRTCSTEWHSDTRPWYFSPSRYTRSVSRFHGILRSRRWHLELESDPQWLIAEDTNAFGAHGLLRGDLTLGGVSVSAGAFLFHDGSNRYLQRRFGGEISVPIGGWRTGGARA